MRHVSKSGDDYIRSQDRRGDEVSKELASNPLEAKNIVVTIGAD
jgi:hypothetical protein